MMTGKEPNPAWTADGIIGHIKRLGGRSPGG
jgi:hypothetical protein